MLMTGQNTAQELGKKSSMCIISHNLSDMRPTRYLPKR